MLHLLCPMNCFDFGKILMLRRKDWLDLEGCLDKTANEYWTEVAIPHVLSSKE